MGLAWSTQERPRARVVRVFPLRRTPTGFRLVAQGCTPQAGYPGLENVKPISTPTGLRPLGAATDATPLR